MDDGTFRLYPHPGVLPTKLPPAAGERIVIRLDGYPPFKDLNRSIRNIKHPFYSAFVKLREAATMAMDGRSWTHHEVDLFVTFYLPEEERDQSYFVLVKYVGGIMDCIDGSHGPSFTYLPIIVQDDRQVRIGGIKRVDSDELAYEAEVVFGPFS